MVYSRVAVSVFLALVSASCSSLTVSTSESSTAQPSTPTSSASTASVTTGQIVGIDNATLSADGRSVDIVVIGPYPMSEGKPCGADYALSSDLVGNVLHVTATEVASRQGDCSLVELVCCEHHLTALLPEGNIVDTVHDVGGMIPNCDLFVRRPEGLYQLNGLPPGWTLCREWAEWNGTWMRLYSPMVDAAEGDPNTLLFGTTFGGQFTTEPESLEPPVTVRGQPAQYERYPGVNNQIQLQWLVDGQKLWLEAFEPHFFISDLVKLADATDPS